MTRLSVLAVPPLWVAWLLSAGSGTAVGQADEAWRTAVPVDGEPFSARLATLGGDWKVKFETRDGGVALPLEDLVYWGAYADSYRSMHIVLADGSLLAADVLEIKMEKIAVFGDLCGQLSLPLSQVRGIVFDPPVADQQRDQLLERIATAQGVEDRLLLRNGDVVGGVVKWLGVPERASPPGSPVVSFAADGRDLEIPLDKALAVILNPALIEPIREAAQEVWLGFRDGSLLRVTGIDDDGRLARLRLGGSVQLETERQRIREELTFLMPRSDRVTYVSDIQPLSYKHIPLLDTAWELERDRSAGGGRLRAAGHVFPKGLGMHSASRVACGLDGRFRRFAAELALDDRVGLQGSVIFRVLLQQPSEQWTRAYESPVVRGGDAPLAMSVDVSGARAMALIVDFADRGDVRDHANWLNARLIR